MKKYDYRFEQDKTDKKEEFSSVGNSIRDLFEHLQVNHEFEALEIAEVWRKLMGDKVATRTEQVSLRGRTLFVKLESAPLKQELMMSKGRILEKINIGNQEEKLIEDIRFL